MKKYLRLLQYELKTMVSDAFNLFILVYPFMMLFLCGYVLPAILARTTPSGSSGQAISLLIGFIVLISIGGFMMGTLLGFSLLENKDENTLLNVAVSPVRVSGYALFKITYTYGMSFLSNLIMVGGLKWLASDAYTLTYGGITVRLLDAIGFHHVLLFSLVSSLIVPFVALLLASLAKNKMEGFAMVKGGGIFIMLPLLLLLPAFQDGKQYLFGILPNFWSIKAMLNLALPSVVHATNLTFGWYMVIGSIYPIGLGAWMLRVFLRKTL